MTEVMTWRDAGVDLLDRVHRLFAEGAVAAGTRQLFVGLDRIRATRNQQAWRRFATQEAPEHALRALVHEDPMTLHSFQKPRGYAGDAVLLDYIYGLRSREHASRTGRTVGDVVGSRAPAAAVRYRRDLIAYRIDQVADQATRPVRVLSVACGHFREGRMSIAVQNGGVEEVVALDADAESLREVAATAASCVTPVELSVRRLLGGRVDLGDFDFVYTAGLYDYLEERVAEVLTQRLFAMLRPGGRLLFCNFLPSCPDIGYMETFMGWELIYRRLDQIERLAAGVPAAQIATTSRYEDGFGSVGYVELTRA